MNRLLSTLFTTYYKFLSFIRGEANYHELFKHSKIILKIHVSSLNQFNLTIYCRKREYLKKHTNSYFKGKIYTVFDVYSTIDESAPESIRDAFSVSMTFPPLVSLYVDDETHAKILINAYIDMVKSRLDEIQKKK